MKLTPLYSINNLARLCAFALTVAALTFGPSPVFGQVNLSYTGNGGAPGYTGPNFGGTAPSNTDGGDNLTFATSNNGYTVPNNRVNVINSITFGGANQFTLTGSGLAPVGITLGGNGGLAGGVTITNTSTASQTVGFTGAGLIVGTAQTFQTNAQQLNVTSNIAVNGALSLVNSTGAGVITLSGTLTGAAPLQIGSTAGASGNAIISAGNPGLTGPVNLFAGTLTVGHANSLGAAGTAGTLTLGYAGALPAVTQTLASTGTQTVNNNIDATNATTVNVTASGGGILTLGGTLLLPTTALTINNTNAAGSVHLDGAISVTGAGNANLTLSGVNGSEIRITGTNTYAGTTTISGASGNVAIDVNSADPFGTSTLVVTGGTVRAVTTAPTGFTINAANYVQTGGTLRLDVYDGVSNDNDKLVVQGTTTSLGAGSTLTLAGGGFAVPTGVTYDLVHATTGTINGQFGTVNGFNNFTYAAGSFGAIDYTPSDVFFVSRQYLGLTPNLDPNQEAIAHNLDSHESASISGNYAALVNAIYTLPASSIGSALDQLSPEQFGEFTSVTAFNNASFETEAMDNYLASQRGAGGGFLAGNGTIDSSGLSMNDPSYDPALSMVHSRMMAWNPAPVSDGLISDVADPMLAGTDMKDMKDSKDMKEMCPAYTNPWNFFVRGNVILAQGFSQADIAHFDDNTESVVLGTDYRITPNFLVGLTAGYAHTDVTLDDNGSSATVDSYSPGFYAAYADKGWYANLSGDYIHNAYTDARNIGFLGQTASSAPEGNEGVANLDGGYDFHQGALTFGPLAGVQYTHLSVDGFSETGSIADLTVAEQDADSLRSRLGGRLSYSFNDCGMKITPHLDATWQHEFLDQSRGISSQFNGFGGGSFSVVTPNASRDSALADLGVDADINRTVTVFADYTAQAGQSNYFGQSVQAGVKIGF